MQFRQKLCTSPSLLLPEKRRRTSAATCACALRSQSRLSATKTFSSTLTGWSRSDMPIQATPQAKQYCFVYRNRMRGLEALRGGRLCVQMKMGFRSHRNFRSAWTMRWRLEDAVRSAHLENEEEMLWSIIKTSTADRGHPELSK